MTSVEDAITRLQLDPRYVNDDDKLRLGTAFQGTYSSVFGGTTYCEVMLLLLILISRLPAYRKEFPTWLMEHFGKMDPEHLGISKRCCPVCAALVGIISRHIGITIQTCGVHPKFSACSLPTWTPTAIAHEIIEMLEIELRPRT
jgi:hypothetical protein